MYIAGTRCQSQSGGVKLAESSLIIRTGYRGQFFSLIFDSSVGLWAGIQSAAEYASIYVIFYTYSKYIMHGIETVDIWTDDNIIWRMTSEWVVEYWNE